MTEISFPNFSILLVDDELSYLRSLSILLERNGINNILTCNDSRNVMDILANNDIGLVLLDITMPHISGIELLELIGENHPNVAVIIISGLNQIDSAVTCLKLGAYDYFIKTTEEDRLIEGIKRTIHMQSIQSENYSLSSYILNNTLEKPDAFTHIVTQSQSMLSIFQYMESIAQSHEPILLTGESGTGKTLLAETCHTLSKKKGPLITLNPAGLSDEMFAKELFGISGKSSKIYPNALDDSIGGTLILDGIADLSIVSQVKVLRLIQKNEFHPAGSHEPRRLQARLILTSGQNLEQRCQQGLFRKDLYYRLCRHQIKVPTLRSRKNDLVHLLNFFIQQASKQQKKTVPSYPDELPLLLANYGFPGNVRELETLVYQAISQHKSRLLSMEVFRNAIKPKKTLSLQGQANDVVKFNDESALPSLSAIDDLLVKEAMRRAKGNQSLAARMLGISQPALSKRLKKSNN